MSHRRCEGMGEAGGVSREPSRGARERSVETREACGVSSEGDSVMRERATVAWGASERCRKASAVRERITAEDIILNDYP